MDYEKKYNEALERAQKATRAGSDVAMDIVQYIFPELAESEDERIINAIIGILLNSNAIDINVSQEKMLAWLEKQKEHQNNSDAPNESSWSGIIFSSHKDMNLDEIAQDYVDGVKEYNPEPTWDLMQTAVCYGYHYREGEEQKPAEWSEEDRKMIDHLIEALPMWANGRIAMLPSQADEYVERLKSLRPSWKPCEEQIHAIIEALKYLPNNKDEWRVLNTLVDVFRKLM